jgi:hypothetical protein
MRVIADVKRGLFTPVVTGPCTDILLSIPENNLVIWMGIDAIPWAQLRVKQGNYTGLGIDIAVPEDALEMTRVAMLLERLQQRADGLGAAVFEALQDWWVNEYRQLKLFVEPENQKEDGK